MDQQHVADCLDAFNPFPTVIGMQTYTDIRYLVILFNDTVQLGEPFGLEIGTLAEIFSCGSVRIWLVADIPNKNTRVSTECFYDIGHIIAIQRAIVTPVVRNEVINVNTAIVVAGTVMPTVEQAGVQGAEDLSVGDKILLQDQLGRPFPALVTALENGMITFDCNHEMAGKELNFRIELLEAN